MLTPSQVFALEVSCTEWIGRAEGQHRMLGHKYGSAMDNSEHNLISWGYNKIFQGTCTLYAGYV